MAADWSRFPRDPRDPGLAEQRASDADRATLLDILSEAYAAGRLDREEHDERIETATRVKTIGEMPALVADLLPGATLARPVAASSDLQARAEQHFRSERRDAMWGFIGPTVICWVIWAAIGFGFPWPAIVMAATGVNAIRVAMSRDEIVAKEVRKLQKRDAKKRREVGGGETPELG